MSDIESARQEFRDSLLGAGVLADLGDLGLYARGPAFDRVYRAVDELTVASMAAQAWEVWRFPPVEPLWLFEKTDYVASFPQLTAALSVFAGGNREHAALLADRADGMRWEGHLEPAGLLMCPAGCHPSYSLLTGTLPEGGRRLDVLGDNFRREPSADPMRMQSFHMHEFIYVGEPDAAVAHRDQGGRIMAATLESLGLEIDYVPANDPFFGRAGRMLAQNQRSDDLKFELVTPVYGPDHPPTAIGSANFHGTHFGEAFEIRTADGEVANSACLGYGLERIVLALFARHGLVPDDWPAAVRQVLWA